MARVTIIGAGGKMGYGIIQKLRSAGHTTDAVETAEEGRARLAEAGFQTVEPDESVAVADAVVIAVPDWFIAQVAELLVPRLRPGTIVICLDPAAPFAGKLPERQDLTYFVTHPCHPSVFKDESAPGARKDRFGGIARQSIVCVLMQGPESDYQRGEALACDMFAPIERSHRVTVEQMSVLEPALAETVSITLLTAIREAMYEAIRRGVPEAAARDFIVGHLGVELAIVFGEIDAQFSDGAIKASRRGASRLLRPDWKEVFEMENIAAEIRAITDEE